MGIDHKKLASTLVQLASTCRKFGDCEQAYQLEKRAKNIKATESYPGSPDLDHRRVAASQEGGVLVRSGRGPHRECADRGRDVLGLEYRPELFIVDCWGIAQDRPDRALEHDESRLLNYGLLIFLCLLI